MSQFLPVLACELCGSPVGRFGSLQKCSDCGRQFGRCCAATNSTLCEECRGCEETVSSEGA